MPVPDDRRRTTEDGKRFILRPSSVFCRPNSIDRKTSLLRDRPEDACGQAASWMWIAHGFSRGDFFGSIPSSRCQTTRAPTPVGGSRRRAARETWFLADEPSILLVEPDGIEPTTSCLQSRRSPN